jgi:hypothetical protein
MQVSQLSRPTPVSSQLTLRRGISMGSAGTGIEHGFYSRPTRYYLSCAAPLPELRRTLAELHRTLSELRCTLAELRSTLSELRLNLS